MPNDSIKDKMEPYIILDSRIKELKEKTKSVSIKKHNRYETIFCINLGWPKEFKRGILYTEL